MKSKVTMSVALAIGMALATDASLAATPKPAEKPTEIVTAKEAELMVKKGVAFIKANGKDKAYTEITSKQSQFTDRDLYLVVYRLDGTPLAHGANEKMVGRNLIDLRDIDGKEFVRERVEMAKAKSSFWQDYKFTNPVTKKVEAKAMYCERLDDTAVCGGIYKQK